MSKLCLYGTVLNSVDTVERSIRSVFRPDADIVITDGGSRDGTYEKLLEISRDYNLRDYEWDKAHGVRTLPVRVGKDAGKAMYAAMVLLALALPPVMLWPWGLLVEASLPLALLSILHVAEVYDLGLRRAVRFRFYVTITFASLYAASIALAH